MGRRFESCRKREILMRNMNKSFFLNLGSILFYIGIFLLVSAPILGSISLFISALLGTLINKQKYLNDNWNKSFLLCATFILLSCMKHIFFGQNSYKDSLDPILSLIGTFNWIPFFWIFWGCQCYLNSKTKRKKTALFLVTGTFPLLVSGFGQYFFNWTGPLNILNGLIIWYQRPIQEHGLTGPFNNQNYAGAWLSLVWPFCIALILQKPKNIYHRFFSLIFLVSIVLAALLTNSRNAWASILGSVPLVLGLGSLLWFLPIIVIISLILSITIFQPLSGGFQDLLRDIIPDKFWLEFAGEGIGIKQLTRLEIYITALRISFIDPFFGIGAGAFPILFELQKNIWRGHPHNIILELVISYGYPVTLILFSTIILLLILSAKILFNKKSLNTELIHFEKAWWVSIFMFCITQLFDVQYFDARISIIAWILFCGLKVMIDEENQKKDTFVEVQNN